jgi:aerobic-type carbon monoxide dehydrogenase small subunit (CoxS/CutS family)
MSLVLDVDGRRNEVDAQAETAALRAAERSACYGPKLGCGVGVCGACTVLAAGPSASADRDACRSARRQRESMHVVQQGFLASRRHDAATAPRA